MGIRDTVEATGFDYYNGSDRVVIRARVPHGAGTREITVTVRPEDIVAMGEALKPVLADPEAGARGHAMWHVRTGRPRQGCSLCPSSSPKTYLCVNGCGRPVNPEDGEDTCPTCVATL